MSPTTTAKPDLPPRPSARQKSGPITAKAVKPKASVAPQADSGVAVIDRAAAILSAFSPATPKLSLAELANTTGLYKSTLLRLTAALGAHGYVVRDGEGRYAVGPAVLALARAHQGGRNLGEVLQPIMRRLVARFGEGCSFYVLREDQRVCLLRVDGPHAIREHVNVGDVLPLGKGSGGRVLAAFSGARGAVPARVREQHFYLSIGERDPDIAGLSAPVFQTGQQLAGALTLAGPRYRISEPRLAGMCAPLLEAAAEATRLLGGDATPLQASLKAVSRASAPAGRQAKPQSGASARRPSRKDPS